MFIPSRISFLMHRALILISVLFLGCVPMFDIHDQGRDHGKSPALILESAERFFISLENGNYDTAWDLLSEKSREAITDDVYRASLEIEKNIKKDDIIKDFRSSGVIFSNYWRAFVNNLDIAMILEHSRWKMGYIKNNKAEILISHKRAEPARLRMFNENNRWRVGLVETFRTKKSWLESLYKELL